MWSSCCVCVAHALTDVGVLVFSAACVFSHTSAEGLIVSRKKKGRKTRGGGPVVNLETLILH